MGGPFIIPLDLGDRITDRSGHYLRKFVGEKELSKNVAAYIGGVKKKIVVDAGIPDPERCLKYHPYAKLEPRKPEQEMEAQLAKAGVKPEEIGVNSGREPSQRLGPGYHRELWIPRRSRGMTILIEGAIYRQSWRGKNVPPIDLW
jgi:hypothetical protein